MQNQQLSVILPVKGRSDYTRRWLDYANTIQWPFKLYVVDGNEDRSLESYLSQNCPQLDYDYKHYQDGAGFVGYFNRVMDALSKINTPLVLIAANDDFYSLDTVIKGASFLIENEDYSVCSGDVIHFNVIPSWRDFQRNKAVYGLSKSRHLNANHRQSVTENSAEDRLNTHCTRYAHTFYGIHRKEQLIENYQLLLDSKIQDVFLMEHFFTLADVMQGKVKRFDLPYMARQRNSKASGKADMYNNGPLQYRFHCSQKWRKDFEALLETLACILSQRTSMSFDDARAVIESRYYDLIKVSNPKTDKYRSKFKRWLRTLKLKLKTQQVMDKFQEIYARYIRSYWRKQKSKSGCQCPFCLELANYVQANDHRHN